MLCASLRHFADFASPGGRDLLRACIAEVWGMVQEVIALRISQGLCRHGKLLVPPRKGAKLFVPPKLVRYVEGAQGAKNAAPPPGFSNVYSSSARARPLVG